MLKVATFNIRTSRGLDGLHSWRFRKAACSEAIVSLAADVVVLQEVRARQYRWLAEQLSDFVFFGAGRDDGKARGERIVLCLSRRIAPLASDFTVRWFSDSPTLPSRYPGARTNRIAVSIRIAGLVIAGLHLEEAPNPNLDRCIGNLIDWFGPNAIIAGDFNCRIDDPALEPLWRIGYRDTLFPMDADGAWSATHHGFTGTTSGTRIDHILSPESCPIHDSGIHRSYGRQLPSDHWPVVATIDPPGA